jgi:hypothetical protein
VSPPSPKGRAEREQNKKKGGMTKMKMGKKTIIILAVFLMVLVSTTFVYALAPLLLAPHGSVRVALRSIGDGSATWYANAPIVYDGSFSVQLKTGTTASDAGAIYIGPLNMPLSTLSLSGITFWAFHGNDITMQPYVNLVLDNGRIIEGVTMTNVTGPMKDLQDQGYPSADLWVQMKPTDQFYTSFGLSDPLLMGKPLGTLASPALLGAWQTAFPTAKVIQIQIIYGFWDHALGPQPLPLTIYIDYVGYLEPETISSSDR